MKDYFLLALRNLSHRRTRSFLTIVGIFIGIATVVGLLALGQGLQDTVVAEFQKLGTDKVTVVGYNGVTGGPLVSSTTEKPLNEDDVRAIRKIRGVDDASSLLMKGAGVSFKGQSKQTFIVGTPTDSSAKVLEETQFTELLQGRRLREGDSDKIVIGHKLTDDFFEKPAGLGDAITIQGKPFQVVGIFKSSGNDQDDSSVYMTMDRARIVFEDPKLVSLILVKVQRGSDLDAVAERIREKLRKLKGQEKGAETFAVSTPQQIAEYFNNIFGVVQVFLVGIAAISLLVGGIGIMNTMYTAILERTKEIGILKAVGAKHNDILALFLIESGLLGLLGGAVGVLVGALLTFGAEAAIRANGYAAFTASLSWELALGALLFSFFVGAISGVLPARSAALLNPADAIRYE